MNEQTVKCPICGEPYKVYPNYSGDQSACESCRWKAERKVKAERFEPITKKGELYT